ncbi:hypothetical protein HRbin20_01814 [bacterium HR20]|nr:hypothetical protein HRbin20_01814 [bacterium HR20]
MQISKFWDTLDDRFPIETEQHAQNTVRGWVLRAHVEHHVVFERVLEQDRRITVEELFVNFLLSKLSDSLERRKRSELDNVAHLDRPHVVTQRKYGFIQAKTHLDKQRNCCRSFAQKFTRNSNDDFFPCD